MATITSTWLTTRALGAFTLLALSAAIGCGGSEDAGGGGSGGAGAAAGSGGGGGTGGAGGAAGAGAGAGAGGVGGEGGAGGGGGSSGTTFSYGVNLGYYNSQLVDTEEAELALAAGANSYRAKLMEYFLDKWGDDIRVQVVKDNLAAGAQEIVCTLVGTSEGHSTAPAGSADWTREQYSPKNLDEPIFTAGGDVNPNNYWASFVARVVKAYGPYIHTWEVWNEPDQVGGNWQATQTWDTDPPKPSDLVWWNDTIYAYVRMLRVTYEVVHKLDPQGKVALGGVGYPKYLNALLRYTDEPTSGKVDADHPEKGGAYFDVVSYHYYPIFSQDNSDVGAKGLVELHDALAAELANAGVIGKTFIVTESGAPRFAVGGKPGGAAYAANYLMKAMALAQNAGVGRIDWFILGDSADPGASTDAFDYMGLYENLTSVTAPSEAKITESGTAYATLGHLLAGASSGIAATAALGSAGAVALTTKDGKRAYVVWADAASGEEASATVSLPAAGDATVYRWDYSKTNQSETVSPSGGAVSVSVTSAPAVVIAP